MSRDSVIKLFLVLSLSTLVACATTAERPAPPAPSVGALKGEANTAYYAKQYDLCGQRYMEAAEAEKKGERRPHVLVDAYYNAACCLALKGEKARALEALELANGAGHRQVENLKKDEDLTSLQSEPGWQRVLQGSQANLDAYLKGSNAELHQLYEQDQGDRANPAKIDWKVVSERDAQRRAQVNAILGRGDAKVSADYVHAAMVFQHGNKPEDFARAHELASKAAEIDPSNAQAKWLAAASKDRHLHSQGKPQIYGTQFRKVDGKWTMEPIDLTAVDDAERARWNVPPLQENIKRMEGMNAGQ